MRIELVPIKGGVGTSTIAATLAAALTQSGEQCNLIVRNLTEVRDQHSIWCRPQEEQRFDNNRNRPIRFVDQISGENTGKVYITYTDFATADRSMTGDFEVNIAIRERHQQSDVFWPGATKILIGERCYMALSNAVSQDDLKSYDAAVLWCNTENALTTKDCKHVLGIDNVFEWQYSPSVARAVDAGIYTGRIKRLNYKDHWPLIEYLQTERSRNASNA